MAFELILLAVAFIGASIAAAYDLKTTEVPDWVFYAMFGIGLPVLIARSLIEGNFSHLTNSFIAGGGLLGFGYLMYKVGQWGGADAVLLGLFGFLLPAVPSHFSPTLLFPFPVSLLFNIFLVGAVYMLVYAAVFAAINKHIMAKFFNDMKASLKMAGLLVAGLFILALGIGFYFAEIFTIQTIFFNALLTAGGAIAFLVIYKFVHAVENFGFKKRIPVSKLRIGDMLLKKRELVGIDRSQLRKIKNSGKKFVWIKEGVRFVPAFPLALLFTLYYGDAVSFLISFL